jgi:hypothetical protein
MSDNQENWKNILGTNQSYQISNLGNVKGKKNNLLKPIVMKIGYAKVTLSLGNKKVSQKYVHHLVVEEFLDRNFKNKNLVINHINGSMLDNRLVNLEIVSRKENAIHWAKKNLSDKRGRKRSGFCGRGHKFKGNQTYCLECARLRRANKLEPPLNFNWKETLIDGYLISDNGKVWSKKTKRLIKSGVNTPGYEYVNLRVNNKTKNFAISRLVYSVFNSSIPDNFVVDHINENKLDNRIQNLRVLSRKENTLASKNEMKKRNQHGFKLDENKVSEIKWLLKNTKLEQKEIAKIYNVGNSLISAINVGDKWIHIAERKPQN